MCIRDSTYTDGKQLETNDIFDTLQDKIRISEIGKVSAINISLKGVENMINRGLFVSEIQRITGFSAKKIIEVYERMHAEKDINKIIDVYKRQSIHRDIQQAEHAIISNQTRHLCQVIHFLPVRLEEQIPLQQAVLQ